MVSRLDTNRPPQRCIDVATRIDNGEMVSALAAEYGVTRVTIWRWKNEGTRYAIPDPDDREAWRAELLATLTDRISSGDASNRDLVALADRISKIVGADHSDAMREREIVVSETQAAIMVGAVIKAIEATGLDADTASRIRDIVAGELEAADNG